MKRFFKFLILFILFSFITKEENHLYEDTEIKCKYQTRDGMLDGKYVSFYKTGIKKAEGSFESNNRIGEWIIWDTIGNMKCKRVYENSFAFSQTFPTKISVSLPLKKDGCYDYAELKEKDVLWETRLWRIISPKNNHPIFDKNKLGDSLIKNILNGKIYLFLDENFYSQSIKNEELKKLNSSYKLVAIKIKEDAFVDISRQLTETRIIAFYPIFKNNADTITPGWIFFPSIRRLLAKIPLNVKQLTLVKNMDDLFYFRFFTSDLEKVMNIKDQTISAMCKDLKDCKSEKDRIEIQIIESNHNHLNLN